MDSRFYGEVGFLSDQGPVGLIKVAGCKPEPKDLL